MKRFMQLVALVTLALMTVSGIAAGLGQPTGPVILTIQGNIKLTNQGSRAVFDRHMIEQLSLTQVTTSTPWTDGVSTFEGPLLRGLIDYVGGVGKKISMVALNDYSASMPMEDMRKYDIVLAMKKDGKTLSVRDKGPFFVIYPFDHFPELNNELIHNRSVWQIKAITVE